MHKDLLEAMGRTVHNFAVLEHYLGVMGHVFIGIQNQSITQCIMAELSFRNLVNLVRSLHAQREKRSDIHAELLELTKRALDVESRRNQILHSLWSGPSEEPVAVRMKKTAKGELKWQSEELTANDLNSFSNSIGALIDHLQSFMKRQKYDFLREEFRT